MLMWEDVDSIWRVKLLRAFLDRTIWEIHVGTRPNLLVNVVFYWMMKPIIEHSLGLYIGILFDLSLQGPKHGPSMGNPSGSNFGLDGPKPNHRLIHSNPSKFKQLFFFFFLGSKAWKLERLELPRYVPTYLVGLENCYVGLTALFCEVMIMLNCHIFSSLVQVIMIATFGVLQVCFANYHPTSCLRRHGSRCHDHGMTPSVTVVLYEILRNDNEFRMVSMMEEEVSVWINGLRLVDSLTVVLVLVVSSIVETMLNWSTKNERSYCKG